MIEQIRRAQVEYEEDLLRKRHVVSVGRGLKCVGGRMTSTPCLVVGVRVKVPKDQLSRRDLVPPILDGCLTDVVELGHVVARAQQNRDWALRRTDRHRPAPGGVSIAHVNVTAGTLGCLVERDGQRFILSNNHVLANSNDAQFGDPIVQPGPHDGGTWPIDEIGQLAEWKLIDFGVTPGIACRLARLARKALNWGLGTLGSNYRVRAPRKKDPTPPEDNLFDAALALPTSMGQVDARILGIGIPTGDAEPKLGEQILKSGRTTEVTAGIVTQVEATVRVSYGPGKTATFRDQVVSDIHSAGGDSGSAIINSDERVVGLLFAGSDTITIFSPIGPILEHFEVEVVS